ncbi:MAG: hypothetical protein E7504_04210 [Ruminococcus sp.]|nr:hypothetical protein [Ruminococcus sp.]
MTETKPTVIVSDNYDKAVRLTRHIAANAHAMQESLYEVCKGLKEMRDGKLYKELGYQNFEDYTENEVGIRRRQAYTYISVAENLREEFVHSGAQIGIKKLGLLAMLDPADRKEIQQTVNIEETSVRELKAQIKALEKKNEEAAEALETAKSKTRNMVQKNVELVQQIKELEQRPVEVAVAEQDEQELARLNNIIEQKNAELDRVRSEYELRLRNAEMRQEALPMEITDTRPVFRAYLANAVDAMKRLTEFLLSHTQDENIEFYTQQTAGLSDRLLQNIKPLTEKE